MEECRLNTVTVHCNCGMQIGADFGKAEELPTRPEGSE